MSDLARLLQQYGYGEQPNALARDGESFDTSNVLAGMPKRNPLADALRIAMNAIPENKELPAPAFPLDPRSLSMANMVRGGLDTAASWLDYQNKPQPNDYKASDVMGPLGAGFMGSMFAPKNALGIFGGRLAKTADHAALAKAEELAAKGADRKDIWDQTGWFQGADGRWRFEIDDSAAAVHPMVQSGDVSRWSLKDGINMQEALSHPSLYDAYPDTAGIGSSGKITGLVDKVMGKEVHGIGGFYGVNEATGRPIIHMEASNPENMRRGLLHELQHDVQTREGFAPGAASNTYTQQKEAELARDALSWRRELDRMPKGMDRSAKDNAVFDKYVKMGAPDWVPSRQARDLALDMHGNPTSQLEELVRFYGLDQKTTPSSPMEMYRRSAGEVEARNVEKRRDMTPAERRLTPPWETEEFPSARQVIDMRGIK